MEVSANKVISLIYELRKSDESGEVVESLTKHNPLTFLFGRGNLLARFEDNIQGLKEGEKFSFRLTSDEAYGPVEENAIVSIPLQAFEVDGKIDYNLIKTGSSVPMVDREGRRMNGIVREVAGDKVQMDFNHPMAGTDLHFSGEITTIREASEEELTHGHVHSSGNCHSCQDDHGCGGCC